MRIFRLPFKHNEDDAVWLSAEQLIPESPLDWLRPWLGPYKRGWSHLHAGWYDPRTIEPTKEHQPGGA